MPYIRINDENFYFSGDPAQEGLPLILIHGSGGSHGHWSFQIESLEPEQEVNLIAVDLPGHGHSEGEPASSIEGYREWIRSFAAALKLSSFALGGHSMGGAIALDYALHYPEVVSGLVLVGTGARLRVAPIILDSLKAGVIPPGMTDYAYGPTAALALLENARREQEATPPAVYLNDFTACDNFDLMAELSGITLPALIICGTADKLTPLKYSEFLKDTLKDSDLVEIPEAGHMAMLEFPGPVNEAILNFVRRLQKP